MISSSAKAYGDGVPGYGLADVPGTFWRKIEMAYPSGKRVVLVYEREPEDSEELPGLMWKLQQAAAVNDFTITVVRPDGSRGVADPIAAPRDAGEG